MRKSWRVRTLLVLLLLWPGLAAAGAWPRAPGEVYVSSGQEFGEDGWTGLYAELGGPRSLTFGLDVGGHVAAGLNAYRTGQSALPDVDGRAIAFVRAPLTLAPVRARWPNWVVAVELGVGADFDVEDELTLDPRVRLGLSVGRPLKTPLGDGWTNIDARIELGGETPRLGLLAVIGARPRERLTLEMGLFVEHEAETFVTLAPTVQYAVPRIGDVRLGVSVGTDGEARLRIGVARTF